MTITNPYTGKNLPGARVAIDETNPSSSVSDFRGMIVGYGSNGSAQDDKATPIFSAEDAKTKYGPESDIFKSALAFYKNDNSTQMFAYNITSTKNESDMFSSIGDMDIRYFCPTKLDFGVGKNVVLYKAALGDTAVGRWASTEDLKGGVIGGFGSTYSAAILLQDESSDNFTQTAMPVDGSTASGSIVNIPSFSGGFAGSLIQGLKPSPNVGLNNYQIFGVQAPAEEFRFTRTERNELIKKGFATFKVNRLGEVFLESTPSGDNISLNRRYFQSTVTSIYIASFLTRNLNNLITRKSIRSDGLPSVNSNQISLLDIQIAVYGLYLRMADEGWVQDPDAFRDEIRSAIDSTNLSTVNLSSVVDIVKNLEIVNILLQIKQP